MHEKIIDIIIWTVEQLQNKHSFEHITTAQLEEQGFAEKDISIAFSWMAELLENKKPNELLFSMITPRESFRVFTEEEKNLFTKDAFIIITKLLSLGIIRAYHIDIIMERADYIGVSKINCDIVRQFVAYYMLELPTPDASYIRYSLCGNESIN